MLLNAVGDIDAVIQAVNGFVIEPYGSLAVMNPVQGGLSIVVEISG